MKAAVRVLTRFRMFQSPCQRGAAGLGSREHTLSCGRSAHARGGAAGRRAASGPGTASEVADHSPRRPAGPRSGPGLQLAAPHLVSLLSVETRALSCPHAPLLLNVCFDGHSNHPFLSPGKFDLMVILELFFLLKGPRSRSEALGAALSPFSSFCDISRPERNERWWNKKHLLGQDSFAYCL